jgi:hypothetical protein
VNADESGHAIFRNQTDGNYGISAERDGYINPTSAALIASQTQTIAITPEKKKFDIAVFLTRGATLSGHVLDPNGVPVAKASVYVSTLTYRDGMPTMSRSGSGSSTDDRGEYRLIGLTAGKFYVSVELRPGSNQQLYGTWDDLPRNSYYPGVIDSRNAALVNITGARDLGGIDVKLPKVEMRKISGTVTNTLPGGRAMPNGQLYRSVESYFLGSTDPNSIDEPVLVASPLTPSNNPTESIFEISAVLPGTYYLYPLFDTGSGSITGYATNRTIVKVGDQDVTGIRISLKPNEDIKGRIVVDGDASTIAWNSIRIGLRRKERLPTLLGGAGLNTGQISDPQTGEFTIAGVPESRFGVTVSGLPPDAYVSDIRQGGRTVFTDGTIYSAAKEPLEIEVRLKGGTVQGIARTASGEPAMRASVVLVPSMALRQNLQLYKRATSNANGEFSFRGIAPGEYKLFAWPSPPPGQAEENAQYLAPFESRGTTVNVMTGGPTTAQVTVQPLP